MSTVASRLTRSPAMLAWLTLVWVGLWGSVTAANVLGGLALSAVLLVLLPVPQQPDQGRVRLLPLLRFVGFFAVELVRASGVVVWQVLRGGRPQQAVLAVSAAAASDRLLTLVANAISLTPGTLTLEVDRERSVLYVHALDVGGPDGVEDARASIARLVRLAVQALGSDESVARVREVRR